VWTERKSHVLLFISFKSKNCPRWPVLSPFTITDSDKIQKLAVTLISFTYENTPVEDQKDNIENTDLLVVQEYEVRGELWKEQGRGGGETIPGASGDSGGLHPGKLSGYAGSGSVLFEPDQE
jgi:hypothetical protein